MISSILIGIIIAYLVLIGLLSFGFDKVSEFIMADLEPKTKFTIVIPFRNEAKQLPFLLDSLIKLKYPTSLFETILVNDDSNDDSVEIIQTFLQSQTKNQSFEAPKISIIENKRASVSPKKDAITKAISNAKYPWIITTDADCKLPPYWLASYDEYLQTNNVSFIIGPVTYSWDKSFLSRFQGLDLLSLQGATIGGYGLSKPFLCNGANMAFEARKFKSHKGFKGNDHIASGDDIFLLEKFLKSDKTKIGYLKSKQAIVTTQPEENVSNLIEQRLRWAAKSGKSSNTILKSVGLIVFLGNLTCVSLIPLVVLELITDRTAFLLFTIKFCADLLLIFKTSRFFDQERLLISYIISSFIYPFFNLYIALFSLFKSYKWKGREFRR